MRLVLDQLDDSRYPRHGYYVLFEDETSLLATNRFSEVHAKGPLAMNESEFGHEPLRQSYSAFAGMTTGFGPLCLGFGVAPGVFNAYFQLGRPF